MDIWQFIGSYWWLALVFGGAAFSGVKGIGAWLDKRSEMRHRQKLELMQARAGVLPSAATPSVSAPVEADSATQLERLFAQHDEITARWLDYELDVAKLIAFPAMSDGRRPLTADFLRAKRAADGIRPPLASAKLSSEDLAAYRDAVAEYGVKFDIAEQDARRVRDTGFTDEERRRLDRAEQLLRTAVDKSATAAERQVAYRRVRNELDGLIVLSPDAVTILESKVAPELGSSPTS